MGNKRVVHIVDDEETIRKALRFTLRTAGFAVEAYASGPEFLSAAGDAKKGCVILDMHMPDMDGLQVQVELTRRGSEKNLGFGAMSTLTSLVDFHWLRM